MELDDVKARIPVDGIKEDIAFRKAVDFVKANGIATKCECENCKHDN